MKTLQQCVTLYQESDEFQKLAASTKKRRLIVLRMLVQRMGGTTPVARLDRFEVDGTLALARRRNVGQVTLNAYRTDLRRFCEWLVTFDLMKGNSPASHLVNDKGTEAAPSKRKPISAAQAAMLVEVAAAAHPRDKMTALLLLHTGLRESEVVGLTWAVADFEREKFDTKRFKTKDHLPAFWSLELEAAIAEWKAYYERECGPVRDQWFVVPALKHRSQRPGHHRMNPDWPLAPDKRQQNISKRVKKWLAAVGETDLVGRATHTLRRTAGNLLLEQLPDRDLRVVQTFYGHKSLSMTELYLDKNAAREKVRTSIKGFQISSTVETKQ